MGTIKDGIDLGIEAVQFWLRFKGRRVRVWPSDLTIRICSESGRKWVTSAEGREPSWWEESRRRYLTGVREPETPSTLVEFAAVHLADAALPNIETVEEAKLFEATISDVIKNPPGIYLTGIQYWVVVGDPNGKDVAKIDSSDEGILLPLGKLARIDFVPPRPFADRGRSSWENE
jgi:hypothetical protein